MEKIKILHYPTDDEPFVIADKPAGLPSAPLAKEDNYNLVHFVSKEFPQILTVKGRKEIEKGLFHRLDTQTSGILLLCTDQEFYDFLLLKQNEGLFKKEYTAICDMQDTCKVLQGFPSKPIADIAFDKEYCVSSFFRKFGANGSAVRPVTAESGKAALKKMGNPKKYSTYITISKNEGNIVSKCRIIEGFRHQVRCHLSWCGFPVAGDKVYNSNAKESDELRFYATSLDFPLMDGKIFHIEKDV